MKHRSGIPDATDERPSKRQCLTGIEDDVRWLKGEISSIRESLREIAAQAREDRQSLDLVLNDILHEVQQCI
jgi:hypothetical protein